MFAPLGFIIKSFAVGVGKRVLVMALLAQRISTQSVIPFSPFGIVTIGFNQEVGSLATSSNGILRNYIYI